MKFTGHIATALFAGALIAAPAISMAQYGYGFAGNGAQYGYNQGPPPPGPGGWDAPPSEFTQQVQRDGFRAGLNGAQHDFENHRPPNVMNRDEFRNYHGPARRLWRDAFTRGYNAWWAHQGPRRY